MKRNQNTYVVDASSAAEMARLIDQDRLISQAIGLFPESLDLLEVRRLLDVACGPGGWAREVARQLPDVEVVGIDLNQAMIEYARAYASVEQRVNCQFQVMDATFPLEFADASFDLVNARLLFAFMRQASWPALIAECARITRPGGTIILTETDKLCTTNSEAIETLLALLITAMQRAGYYAGTDGGGVTPRLSVFLSEIGLKEIQSRSYRVQCHGGTPEGNALISNLQIALKVGQPFLLSVGTVTQEHLDHLYEQAMLDMLGTGFQAYMELTRVWGQKP